MKDDQLISSMRIYAKHSVEKLIEHAAHESRSAAVRRALKYILSIPSNCLETESDNVLVGKDIVIDELREWVVRQQLVQFSVPQ